MEKDGAEEEFAIVLDCIFLGKSNTAAMRVATRHGYFWRLAGLMEGEGSPEQYLCIIETFVIITLKERTAITSTNANSNSSSKTKNLLVLPLNPEANVDKQEALALAYSLSYMTLSCKSSSQESAVG